MTCAARQSACSRAPDSLISPRTRLLAYGCLASSMALSGVYVAFSKPLVAALPVFLLAWIRFGIAAAAMLPWLRKPADEAPLTARVRWLLFLESFLGNFLFSICMLYGVSMTSAVSAGVVLAGIPASIAVMSAVFLRERVGTRTWLAAVCAVTGLGLLALSSAPGDRASGSNEVLGNLLVFGAVLCEGAYAVIGKRLTGSVGPKRISALINLWGFALTAPLGMWWALRFDFSTVQPGVWLLVVFYALAASVFTVWLWMTGVRHVPAAQAGIFTVMLPISSALVGVLVLGESMSVPQVLAFAIALAGIALVWSERTAPGRA